ncbi:helix-turn-helix transcriptional regulator, partial [Streptomyces sp. SID10244]|nr:helix-turn-helix transcriptional regulator [Streptomyces sp. SID10244]
MDGRERLAKAGVELLERDGLAELTQCRIATAAGVSHGAPRHHFPTYAGLLAAIAREGIDDLNITNTTSLRELD